MTEPVEYCFRCDDDGDGQIFRAPGDAALWSFQTPYQDKLFGLPPDFSCLDPEGNETLTVRCDRKYPLARFTMLAGGVPVGTIRQTSPLLNKYTLAFTGGETWTLHLKLFIVSYKAVAAGGAEIQVQLYRHDTWYLQFPPGLDDPQLVAGLAFVHKHRQKPG